MNLKMSFQTLVENKNIHINASSPFQMAFYKCNLFSMQNKIKIFFERSEKKLMMLLAMRVEVPRSKFT